MRTEVSAQGSSSDWWPAYLNGGYSAGILKHSASQQRFRWRLERLRCRGQISRYDMARSCIMWLWTRALRIPPPHPWLTPAPGSRISPPFPPITSMRCSTPMPRASSAVARTAASTAETAPPGRRPRWSSAPCSRSRSLSCPPPTNNSNRLTDNSAVTEENVSDLLRELEAEYPSFDQWNTDRVYTSKVLGRGSGEAGFAYMLSDRVFGAIFSYELDDPEDLRVGDLIYDDYEEKYG